MSVKNCSSVQQSLSWCEGQPVRPGIKKRAYYTSKSLIVKWPSRDLDDNGKPKNANLIGSFKLQENATWKHIDHLPAKAEFKSETQGEYPSQTQKNSATLVHPSVGVEATAATAYLTNSDNVYLVEDAAGNFRVLGCEEYETTTTVAQDNGQSPTGSAATTIAIEASDFVASPFYYGEIVTEDGTINEADE
jgi:hypothetical protein